MPVFPECGPHATVRGVPPRTKTLLTAFALCVAIAAMLSALPALGGHVPAPVAFLVVMIVVLPLLVQVQRAWTRFLWTRRLNAARLRAEAAPNDADAQVEFAVLCTLAGTEAEARAAFEKARALSPGHPQATVGLAHLAAEDGNLDLALTLFTEAAEKDPELFSAQYGIGGVQRRREQYARAILAYERALVIEPDDAFTLAELSRCHLLLGDPEKASDYFARAAGQGLRDPDLEKLIREAAASTES